MTRYTDEELDKLHERVIGRALDETYVATLIIIELLRRIDERLENNLV